MPFGAPLRGRSDPCPMYDLCPRMTLFLVFRRLARHSLYFNRQLRRRYPALVASVALAAGSRDWKTSADVIIMLHFLITEVDPHQVLE